MSEILATKKSVAKICGGCCHLDVTTRCQFHYVSEGYMPFEAQARSKAQPYVSFAGKHKGKFVLWCYSPGRFCVTAQKLGFLA